MTVITAPPTTGLSIKHATWLDDRRIPCEIAAEAGLRSRGEQLIIPYTLSGTELFAKIRGPGKKFWIEPSGVPLVLWGLDTLEGLSPDTPLIITEGEFDALAWRAVGAPAVISVPNGASGKVTNFSNEKFVDIEEDRRFAYLWTMDGKLLPALRPWKKIIISTDGDEPGILLANELANRLGPERCWHPVYPDPAEGFDSCKDANDVLVQYGADGINALMEGARPFMSRTLCSPYEIVLDDTPALVSFDQLSDPDKGDWTGINKHLRISAPELIVVTGSPGSGKSQFVLNIAANLARLHGQKGAILQLEDSPRRNIQDLERYAEACQKGTPRMATVHTKDGSEGRIVHDGTPIRMPPKEWVRRMFRMVKPYVTDDGESYTLDWLKRVLTEAAHIDECKWAIIDPWNEIEHLWHVNETEVAYTNRALAELKALARLLQITLFVVAHPSKGGGQKDNIREMSLYDVSGSAAFKNKADHGIVVMRPSARSTRVYVKVDKSKDHGRLGTPGVVTMQFNPKWATYSFIGDGVIDEQLNQER